MIDKYPRVTRDGAWTGSSAILRDLPDGAYKVVPADAIVIEAGSLPASVLVSGPPPQDATDAGDGVTPSPRPAEPSLVALDAAEAARVVVGPISVFVRDTTPLVSSVDNAHSHPYSVHVGNPLSGAWVTLSLSRTGAERLRDALVELVGPAVPF